MKKIPLTAVAFATVSAWAMEEQLAQLTKTFEDCILTCAERYNVGWGLRASTRDINSLQKSDLCSHKCLGHYFVYSLLAMQQYKQQGSCAIIQQNQKD